MSLLFIYLRVTIPYAKLRKGANTIGFSEFTVTDFFSHAMYDYLSLEGYVATPPSPQVENVSYCQNEVASTLTAIGTGLKWCSTDSSAIPLVTTPIPTTSIVGTTSYFVTQTLHGIESKKVEIKVTVNPLPTLTHYTRTDTKPWSQTTNFIACKGENVLTRPWPNVATGWSWKAPNGFTSSIRNPILNNISSSNAGIYTATYTNGNGCKNSLDLTIQVSSLLVSIINPVNNAIVTTNTVAINAGVSGGNIGSVSFYNGTSLLGSDATSPYTFTTPSLANGIYSFSAIAKNTFNCTDTANVTVKVNKVVTGIEEESVENEKLSVSPNPFQNQFSIQKTGYFEYSITDIKGVTLEKGNAENTKSLGENLSSGVYIITITDNKSAYKASLIKQ